MYFKNIVLLFCVTLYFLQCQGDRPTRGEREIISGIVKKYKKRHGTGIEENGNLFINFKGVKDVIIEVSQVLYGYQMPPSLEKLKKTGSKYKFTLLEVQRYVKDYLRLKKLSPALLEIVKLLFSQYEKPQSINFEDLKDLIGKVQAANANAKFVYLKYPKTAIPYKMEKSVYKFTRKEVESIVIHYLYAI
ncbi:uncharacterized protein LOC126837353 [Adelges cooleyi]|uniref:uncharacterized protein LOC126837353 n=1 Tax=Adelges cooleyi TaxID=133065 RepID=UPI00217FC9D0|nr:uncharacterized protein LOC126837353 [Adelges cooleyi]